MEGGITSDEEDLSFTQAVFRTKADFDGVVKWYDNALPPLPWKKRVNIFMGMSKRWEAIGQVGTKRVNIAISAPWGERNVTIAYHLSSLPSQAGSSEREQVTLEQ
ncbi:MAG: hypothetical protein GTO21_06145 [Armatimonadetes bacterium]|nr:hypothetical protein [Armatimonadota bacterium]